MKKFSNVKKQFDDDQSIMDDFKDYPSDFSDKEEIIVDEQNNINQNQNQNDNAVINTILENNTNQCNENQNIVTEEDEYEEFLQNYTQNELNFDISMSKKPKHLEDCLLGLLQNENRERFIQSLKYSNYLIRKNLDNLDLISEDIFKAFKGKVLLKVNDGIFEFKEFDEYRKKSLIALIIMQPQKISGFSLIIMKRFYGSECSLGDKHFILLVLEEAVQELADNFDKYPCENFSEYTNLESSDFYFKKAKTIYYDQKKVEENKEQERSLKLLPKQKRKMGLHQKSV